MNVKKLFVSFGLGLALVAVASGQEKKGGEVVVVKQLHVMDLPEAKSGFLRCQFTFFVVDAELGAAMVSETPTAEGEQARAVIHEILQRLTVEDMATPEIREVVKMDVKEGLNEAFGGRPSREANKPPAPAEPISNVLITEWVVQLEGSGSRKRGG